MSESVNPYAKKLRAECRCDIDHFIENSFSAILPTIQQHFPTVDFPKLRSLVVVLACTSDFSINRSCFICAQELIHGIIHGSRRNFAQSPKPPRGFPGFQHPTRAAFHCSVTNRIVHLRDDTLLRIRRHHPEGRPQIETHFLENAAGRCADLAADIAEDENDLTQMIQREKARLLRLVEARNGPNKEVADQYIAAAECWIRVIYDVLPKAILEVKAKLDVHDERERLAERWTNEELDSLTRRYASYMRV